MSPAVRVVGVADDGTHAFTDVLGQGADPRTVAYDRGYVLVSPIDAVRQPDAVIDVRFEVQPVSGQAPPRPTSRGIDAGLDPTGLEVEVRQRVAAYAVVTSELGLLATEFSDRTAVPGRWGLPGGGIDAHEQPAAAVLREVAEETRQLVTLGGLVDVQTSHWIGRSPRDTIEDYHAVRLVYSATCAQPTTPVVVDVGGTTESARWVPVDQWPTLDWTAGWLQILTERLGRG